MNFKNPENPQAKRNTTNQNIPSGNDKDASRDNNNKIQ